MTFENARLLDAHEAAKKLLFTRLDLKANI